MKMIYNPIHFVKLVQKILVRNYEPIMGIWKKLFLIDLHNLQMLFMLRIKYKFSECLAPCTNMQAPNGTLFGDGCVQARSHRGQSREVTPKFCYAQKKLF